MRIGLVALREQYEALKGEIDGALASVIGRSAFIGGPEVAEFERWFARFCGVAHAVGVSSGTRALELALRALDGAEGSEVIVPAHTFIATAAAVSAAGARPVFVDVDERTFNLDPTRLAAAITPQTRAVVAVHLYGRPAPIRAILDEVAPRGIAVIEDAAHAHGARSDGARIGSLAAAAAFSFYPTKNLGAFGDAGLVTTGDEDLARRVALLRDHGRTGRYEHAIVGYTARLDNLQAAVLRVQAERLDAWNASRRQIARWYRELLPAGISVPEENPRDEAVYHLFVVRIARRDAFRAFLETRGIATAIHYPVPPHLQPAYRHLGYSVGDFPVTERLAREIVSLPMHPFITRSDVEYIAAAAAEFRRAES